MAESTLTLSHPDFGELTWLADYSHWYAQIGLPAGCRLDVIVDPGEGEKHEFIEPAARLFRWGLQNERNVLREALRAELLELFNDTWRQGDEPELTEDELEQRLEWQLLAIRASKIVPVEFSYDAGELFGHHGVTVKVGADLQFRGIELRG